MLQNVHLMQDWLPILERHLELLSEHSHEDFRVFLSAEPPAFSYQKIMPESLLQNSIKVANEVPADMRSNLRRAWANFSQEWVDECPKDVNLKGCLFTLCFYHALVGGMLYCWCCTTGVVLLHFQCTTLRHELPSMLTRSSFSLSLSLFFFLSFPFPTQMASRCVPGARKTTVRATGLE